MDIFIKNAKYFVLAGLIFVTPFFFLNITQEYFITNKFYFLGFGVLLLLVISTIEILVTKKMSWEKRGFDNFVLLFFTSTAIAVVFSSPNKIQALLNPNFGLLMMIFLGILYFYLSRADQNKSDRTGSPLPIIYHLSSIMISLITIIFFFQPFKNITLPQNLSFLKNPGFTPVGSQLDLAILLGFFVIIEVVSFPRRRESSDPGFPIRSGMTLAINFFALSLTIFSLIKTPLQLPPFRLSWFAAVEILKSPRTALFGIGPDNFSSIFTQVKDFAYNQSPLWQVNSFGVSRSAVLQIFTETGILGILSFGLLIFSAFKFGLKQWNNGTMKQFILIFVYLFICLFVLPASFIVWFLFFVILGLMNQTSKADLTASTSSADLTN